MSCSEQVDDKITISVEEKAPHSLSCVVEQYTTLNSSHNTDQGRNPGVPINHMDIVHSLNPCSFNRYAIRKFQLDQSRSWRAPEDVVQDQPFL
ncbi:hypothetical protein F2Q69_00003049 [Brassica cretica]|uniref:Uncharacterized protein n=1 Tax=Brassica cretica TaxID=69181 RepID=A0A8S9P6D0_BRACR|nr:hypothetical protein F2Q69_00003049 [Brassica cretica]